MRAEVGRRYRADCQDREEHSSIISLLPYHDVKQNSSRSGALVVFFFFLLTHPFWSQNLQNPSITNSFNINTQGNMEVSRRNR